MKRILIAALCLSGCRAEPRSTSYFEAHPEDAQRVVSACKAGTHRGGESESARAGLAAIEADKRLKLFKKSFE